MLDYSSLFPALHTSSMVSWSVQLEQDLKEYFASINHGDYPIWRQSIEALPWIESRHINFDQAVVEIGSVTDCDDVARERILQSLKLLMPWRKGPFNFFGIELDAEWRSDWKWQRIEKAISSLQGRTVLDIGCGNGYYLLRMLGRGAHCVIGSDPTLRFLMQFEIVKKYCPYIPAYILPFGIQDLPHKHLCFDTVFSMGVIYHRRDPHEHLRQLNQVLKEGGELVLEGLVLKDEGIEQYGDVLIPDKRYAKMNNVWSIPTIDKLVSWLNESGFSDVEIADVSATTIEEQRITKWMEFESLVDFLDPADHSKTIEGYPAPTRAIIIAKKN